MSDLEEAAKAYVEARVEMESAIPSLITTHIVKVSNAYHKLQVLCRDECYICDPGTCEGP